MKIVIGYPPLDSPKGIPFLGQNRQFQWATAPWNAYPMVPAYAATMLKKEGFEVAWLDGITKGQKFEEWLADLKKEKPDLLVIETKTPVVKKHWKIIKEIKKYRDLDIKIVLVGDHVTALPEESLENSPVDFVLTGGDYDFLLVNLCKELEKSAIDHRPLIIKNLEPGIWFRESSKLKIKSSKLQLKIKNYKNTGKFLLNHNLDSLPFVDRDLTCWQLYAYKNSNYSRTPGTYTMFGRDCWWGKCSFCAWTLLFPGASYRVMSPKRALDEIGYILENWPVKEIMDDSGTFPVGDWLREFCEGMIKRGYNQKIKIDCNMRFNNGLKQKDYNLMAKAGFRFLLFGLESANQKTLDRINKNLKVSQIGESLRMAKKAGLWPHITVMVGYPWEDKKDALQTLNMAREFFKKGWVDTLQATVVIPYPGTPLFEECKKNGWLKTLDWDRYDMKEPVMKTPMKDEEIMGLVRSIYSSFLTPEFILRKLKDALTDWEKAKYYAWLGWKWLSKRKDFND